VSAWKEFERSAARIFLGFRYWANAGERVDVEGTLLGKKVRVQCKLVKTLSLEALTKLAEERGIDVVVVKRRRGKGKQSPTLIVFTESNLLRLLSGMTSSTPTAGRCASSAPSPLSSPFGNTSPSPNGPNPYSGLSGLGSYLVNPKSLPGQLPL